MGNIGGGGVDLGEERGIKGGVVVAHGSGS